MKKTKGTAKKLRKRIIPLLVIAAIVVAGFGIVSSMKDKKAKDAMNQFSNEATATRQNLISSVSGSAVVQPKDQYSITSFVNGDVLTADFEQGDMVEKDEILYTLDASDAQSGIDSAAIAQERAKNNYDKSLSDQKDLTITADVSGVIKTLHIKKGDTVQAGAKIADIYDDSVLLLTIPFNESDIALLYTGAAATVQVSGTGDTLTGTVSEIKGASYAKSGNMLVRDLVIRVNNPGTLMITDTAVATVGSVSCNDAGTFEYLTEKTVTAKASGDVASLYVSEGGRVAKGNTIAQLSNETISQSIKNNELSLKDADNTMKNARDRLEDYTITAPISGTVVEKNVKAGDKLDNTSASTVMAVIYDMSSLEFELAVDELDIKNIKLDQEVIITSDALEGKTYHGIVSNININGTTENGVTTYPVTVNILDFDEALLPGMNIDAEIITSRKENVLCIPVSALNRGDVVYVKGDKTEENDQAPEGFKSVKVETGVYNDSYIEIVRGINEGEVVYVPTPEASEFNMGEMMGEMHGGMASGAMGGGGGMPAGGGMGGPPMGGGSRPSGGGMR